MSGQVHLRLATTADEAALLAVFLTARDNRPELSMMPSDIRRHRLEAEYASRQRSYAVDFQGVIFLVVCVDGGEIIGRLYRHTAPEWIFLVDIALLPEWRGRGIGTALIRGLLTEARETRRSMRLHVEKSNAAARRLYERLGFRIIGDVQTHWLMEALDPL